MHKFITSKSWRLIAVLALVFSLFPLSVAAQEPDPQAVETTAFDAGLPTSEVFEALAEPPTPTEEQLAQLEYWIENTHLPGPVLDGPGTEVAGPPPGAESLLMEERARSGGPLAPGDAQIYRMNQFGAVIPPGFTSNVMESSVGISGKFGFYTGNWFAARSVNGGANWTWYDPFSGFANFCCDQVTTYDEARDIFLWLRMGLPDGNGENVFKLSVSYRNAFGPPGWWTYTIAPTNINPAWTNLWWDYPHIQLGANYMYLSWNMFDQSGFYVQSVMMRVNLDNLAAAGPFAGAYLATTAWATFVPVQGAYHSMYWASTWPNSLPQNSRIGIWKWDEDSNTIFFWDKAITAWTFTNRGDAFCGGAYNWAARYDQRVLTGARYSIYTDGITEERIPGRKVLGWWWNVAQGGNFPRPYIEGAAFYEDTMTQLPGNLGRPLFWSPDFCFAYPSITPNKRQDLGAIFHFGRSSNAWRPNVGYAMADDYVGAPPGWLFFGAAASRALPSDNVWGDYNTVREFEPTQKAWVAGSHIIPQGPDCSRCSAPVYFAFGRQRDRPSWQRWQRK